MKREFPYRETFIKLGEKLRPSIQGQPTTPTRSDGLCERLVPVLGRFCSYQAGVVLMSTR